MTPGEAQQDEHWRVVDLLGRAGIAREEAKLWTPRVVDAALAARPSADTETLRRVRELADELERRGHARMTASRNSENTVLAKQLRSGALARLADVNMIRAALDGDDA